MERKGLGRGLSSLVGGIGPETPGDRILQVGVDEIRPNPQQPRQEWDQESLEELAASIRVHGILQPVTVRGRPGSYELVAGERRLRAARLAGLSRVPAILREADEETSLKLALIENIQREDISPLDAAHAYQQLVDGLGMSQDDVAQAVGKSRPAIANALRLLRLPEPIRESLRCRAITEGHARALLAVQDPAEQERLWKLAESGATVREIEAGGRAGKQQPSPAATPSSGGAQLQTTVRHTPRTNPHLAALADQLRRALGVKVEIRGDDQNGQLLIEYYSPEDLQSLADRLLQPEGQIIG